VFIYIVVVTVTGCILETILHTNCNESGKGTGLPGTYETILAKSFYLEEFIFVLFPLRNKQQQSTIWIKNPLFLLCSQTSQVHSNNQSICFFIASISIELISRSPDIFLEAISVWCSFPRVIFILSISPLL